MQGEGSAAAGVPACGPDLSRAEYGHPVAAAEESGRERLSLLMETTRAYLLTTGEGHRKTLKVLRSNI